MAEMFILKLFSYVLQNSQLWITQNEIASKMKTTLANRVLGLYEDELMKRKVYATQTVLMVVSQEIIIDPNNSNDEMANGRRKKPK